MKIEEKLYRYKEQTKMIPEEADLLWIMETAQETLAEKQQNIMPYPEFLKSQFHYIRKRWWILQFLLMAGMLMWMEMTGGYLQFRRELGVFSVLFVVLVIPELWKNQSSQSVEVECAAYYSLRQIYAARLLILAAVDVLMFSIFFCMSSVRMQLSAGELIVQCLLPCCVTACICFQTLCSRRHFSETAAISFCLCWNMIWLFIVMEPKIYNVVSLPVWIGILSVTIGYLGTVVYRTLRNCENYLEGMQVWN